MNGSQYQPHMYYFTRQDNNIIYKFDEPQIIALWRQSTGLEDIYSIPEDQETYLEYLDLGIKELEKQGYIFKETGAMPMVCDMTDCTYRNDEGDRRTQKLTRRTDIVTILHEQTDFRQTKILFNLYTPEKTQKILDFIDYCRDSIHDIDAGLYDDPLSFIPMPLSWEEYNAKY
jgi:hypothetical protein